MSIVTDGSDPNKTAKVGDFVIINSAYIIHNHIKQIDGEIVKSFLWRVHDKHEEEIDKYVELYKSGELKDDSWAYVKEAYYERYATEKEVLDYIYSHHMLYTKKPYFYTIGDLVVRRDNYPTKLDYTKENQYKVIGFDFRDKTDAKIGEWNNHGFHLDLLVKLENIKTKEISVIHHPPTYQKLETKVVYELVTEGNIKVNPDGSIYKEYIVKA